MARRLLTLLAAASLLAAGCSTFSNAIDAINPFAASGPKMAPLTSFEAKLSVRDQWSASIGKAGDYTFTPAVVGNAVYVAARDGTV
ncbi:MAG: outer membrane protein assembly factor BamB, partial [Azonexus sp.]